MTNEFREIIEATVTVMRSGGRGVLVPGNLILTAAHCIGYDLDGKMVLGDYYLEELMTFGGDRIKASPLAVEPVCDIAVLGSPDNQALAEEAMLFNSICKNTRPALLCSQLPTLLHTFEVFVYDHNGIWIPGRAELYPPMIWVQADGYIGGGASGGPIINESGELVSVCSNFSEESKSNGNSAFINLALPLWIYNLITEANQIEIDEDGEDYVQ